MRDLSLVLADVLGGLLEAGVALLVCAAGAEADTDESGPCPPLEEEDGEDDAEAETEGGLDEEVREAAIPLLVQESLADGAGNGARGRGDNRRGGIGHGGQGFGFGIIWKGRRCEGRELSISFRFF